MTSSQIKNFHKWFDDIYKSWTAGKNGSDRKSWEKKKRIGRGNRLVKTHTLVTTYE